MNLYNVRLWIQIVSAVCIRAVEIPIPIYELKETGVTDFPFPPLCDVTREEGSIKLTNISLWTISEQDLTTMGIMYWEEELTTSCYTGFFGAKTTEVLGSRLLPAAREDGSRLEQYLLKLSLEEILDANPGDRYACTWMTTQRLVTIRRWFQKVEAHHLLDGSLIGRIGEWMATDTAGHYQSLVQRLYIKENLNFCPSLIKETYPGIIREEDDTKFVTIPTRNLQFSISLGSHDPICTVDRQAIFKTHGGYLVSFGILTSPDQLKRNSSSQLRLKGLASDLSGARSLYDFNHLETLVEHELHEIEIEICEIRTLIWATLSPPELPDKIARFVSGVPYARGKTRQEKIVVLTPQLMGSRCSIPSSRKVRDRYLLLSCEERDVWIEPLTNIIKTNLSKPLSYVGPWVKTEDGAYVNYISGEVSVPPGVKPSRLARYIGNQLPPLYHLQHQFYESSIRQRVMQEGSLSTSSPDFLSTISGWFGSWESTFSLVFSCIMLVLGLKVLSLVYKMFSGCNSSSKSTNPSNHPFL